MTITINAASVSNGVLSVGYTVDGVSGNKADFNVSDIPNLEPIGHADVLNLIVKWANARGITPAQSVGKTITLNFAALANLVTVG